MKKLNKRGFTLIELLAVIVILAIIVVVTVPTILNSIKDARLSSLHSLSKEIANWYDTSAAQDNIALNSNKILKDAKASEEWECLANIKNSDGVSLFEIYGLSETDIFIGEKYKNVDNVYVYGNSIEDEMEFDKEGKSDTDPEPDSFCSAIRINNGRAEVYLVASDEGKFDTNGYSRTYAVSFGANAYDNIN